MIYGMDILKKISDKFALQAGLDAGDTPLRLSIKENNEEMLKYFLKAARLAKVQVEIDHYPIIKIVEHARMARSFR